MTPELFFLLAVFHGAVALLTTGANLWITQRRLVVTAARDQASFRLALAAELVALRALYRDNIAEIYAGRDALASARMFSVIYRANLGRLQLLSPETIGEVVAAYAMSERIEAFAAVHCKAHGQNGFSMGKDRAFADALIARYEQAAASADRALAALGEPKALPEAPPAPALVRRLKAA